MNLIINQEAKEDFNKSLEKSLFLKSWVINKLLGYGFNENLLELHIYLDMHQDEDKEYKDFGFSIIDTTKNQNLICGGLICRGVEEVKEYNYFHNHLQKSDQPIYSSHT